MKDICMGGGAEGWLGADMSRCPSQVQDMLFIYHVITCVYDSSVQQQCECYLWHIYSVQHSSQVYNM